jgi:hypothetical protein
VLSDCADFGGLFFHVVIGAKRNGRSEFSKRPKLALPFGLAEAADALMKIRHGVANDKALRHRKDQ